ncbi:hypothetical protein R1sor_008225 [Riccia sorocarpa]|uniref:Uncharacterized protein n=1 Tax=Riccia sorocarpa TaxID=122646 RepID=A0ABD3HW71_9MARC
MKWKAETVYLYVITHRQEFRKNQKRRQSASSSTEGKKQTRYDPLAQLMSDEPQLMSNILKGGKIGFYVLKERPTSEGLKLRGKMNFIGDSVASVDELDLFDAMGGKVVHVARSYSQFISSAKLSENLDLAKWLTDSNSVNIGLLGDIKPETTAAAKESYESFKACDGPLPTEEEEDTGKVVHSKGTSEDLKSKLGDEVFSVIAMVLTGSLNKDEVPTRLKDFIAKQNQWQAIPRTFNLECRKKDEDGCGMGL